MLVYGKNVLFSMDARKIRKVYVSDSLNDRKVFAYLRDNNIRYEVLPKHLIDYKCKANHQGVLILVDEFSYCSLEDLLGVSFLVILDHLEDPHNFGAIIRSCEALGVGGIIIPRDRSVHVNDTVMKTSAGTANVIKICEVTNIVNAIKVLKKSGYFVYGSKMDGKDYRSVSYAPLKVLVIGNEGKGISPLVLKCCDEVVKIPMKGSVNSLNASVACALLIMKMGEF